VVWSRAQICEICRNEIDRDRHRVAVQLATGAPGDRRTWRPAHLATGS
jgi:hypothetical protein